MKEQIARLGKGTLIYGIGQGIAKLIGFLMLPLLTTYLTPADYGIISILTVVSFIASPVFGLGLASSIAVVYYNQPHTGREVTIWSGFVIMLASSVLLLTIVFFFPASISELLFQTREYADLVKIMGISTVFNGIINQPFVFRLQFEEKSKVYVGITSAGTLVTVALTVLFVVVLEKGVWGFMIGTLIGNVISFTCYFLAVVGWTRVKVEKKVILDLIRYGLPMVSSFFFLFVLQNAGRFILQRYSGISDVGVYSFGHTFGMIISLAVTAFTTSWFPYFNSFADKQAEARKLFGKITIYYTLALGSLCLCFFIVAKPMVFILTESSFHEAYKIVGLISVGNFLVGIAAITSSGVYFKKKPYLLNYAQGGAMVASVLFAFLLIPSLGIMGAAISFLVGYIFLLIIQAVINNIYDTLPIDYDRKRFVYFIVTAVIVAGLSSIPRNFSLAAEISLSIAGTGILCIVMYRQLKYEERRTIIETLKKVMSSKTSD